MIINVLHDGTPINHPPGDSPLSVDGTVGGSPFVLDLGSRRVVNGRVKLAVNSIVSAAPFLPAIRMFMSADNLTFILTSNGWITASGGAGPQIVEFPWSNVTWTENSATGLLGFVKINFFLFAGDSSIDLEASLIEDGFDASLIETDDNTWIRFTLDDKVVPFILSDEEIDAYLTLETATGEAKKYFAAADLLGVLMLKWSSLGEGVAEKQVKGLRVKFGLGDRGEAGQVISTIQEQLKKRGAELLSPPPYSIQMI